MNSAAKRKPTKPRVYLRVIKGGLEPADPYAALQLRAKGYHIGDVLVATLVKLNNPGFNRLHHRIGQLCAANIEAFHGMDAHQVLKRIQWEANIHCEEVAVLVGGTLAATMRFPLSISFENMDDGQRHDVVLATCRWISKTYWPSLTSAQVEEMAESFVAEI